MITSLMYLLRLDRHESFLKNIHFEFWTICCPSKCFTVWFLTGLSINFKNTEVKFACLHSWLLTSAIVVVVLLHSISPWTTSSVGLGKSYLRFQRGWMNYIQFGHHRCSDTQMQFLFTELLILSTLFICIRNGQTAFILSVYISASPTHLDFLDWRYLWISFEFGFELCESFYWLWCFTLILKTTKRFFWSPGITEVFIDLP